MARISHSLEFGSVGKTLTIMAVGRHLATVLFALAGLGPMSLALGQVVAIIIELAVLRRYTGLFIKPGLFSMAMVHDVRGSLGRILSGVDRRWIWLSAIALSTGYIGAGLSGGFTRGTLEGVWIWLLYGTYTVAAAWVMVEPLRHYAIMRKRLRLRLAEPLVISIAPDAYCPFAHPATGRLPSLSLPQGQGVPLPSPRQ